MNSQFSKLLNYIQWDRTKVATFVFFIGVWRCVPLPGPAHGLFSAVIIHTLSKIQLLSSLAELGYLVLRPV